MKVLIVVQTYPQISETYIKNEIDQLGLEHEIEILALNPGNYPYRNRKPHLLLTETNKQHIIAYLKSFTPDIIHGHYLAIAKTLLQLSQVLDVPFTLRTHSFDVLGLTSEKLVNAAGFINSGNCLGVLAFPFLRSRLESAGIKAEMIIDCFPVINYPAFLDTSDNGEAIMNVGATIPKKNMRDYLKLSTLLPDKSFNLYAMGYNVNKLIAANKELGGRVDFIPPVEPEDMPQHYKRHEWLVYTASSTVNTVGWPLAIAEAQATGVGVCMQNVRPDLKDYVGDAGFVFDSIEEAAAIIAKPFSQQCREHGFELARRCDITRHITSLTGLWK